MFTFIGMVLCLSQSAMFSGLNLAVFGLSRLDLEVDSLAGDDDAKSILDLREDSNWTLCTILWGNVAVNVLLAMLADSALAGISAFLFSTVFITLVGEILPQAYFSRNALRVASTLAPILRAYRLLLYPVAKPSALFLDWWLGKEDTAYLAEEQLRGVIARHVRAPQADLDYVEGVGALNFLSIDDVSAGAEGEPLDPRSVIRIDMSGGRPQFPPISRSLDDPFLKQIHGSGKKWVVLLGADEDPRFLLDADGYLRHVLLDGGDLSPQRYCHRPIVIYDAAETLGNLMRRLTVHPERIDDDVIDRDVILLWTDEPRIITGADLLGRLLRGVSRRAEAPADEA